MTAVYEPDLSEPIPPSCTSARLKVLNVGGCVDIVLERSPGRRTLRIPWMNLRDMHGGCNSIATGNSESQPGRR